MTKDIVGIDEVGRGCWAGPLVAAAVIIDDPSSEIKDSKQLSKKKREELSDLIFKTAQAVGIGWATVEEVNELGLTESVSIAMERALSLINYHNKKIIIDGNYNYLPKQRNVEILPKADALIPSVGAASIIAKVFRDNWMQDLAVVYPGFGFEKHVGYGTRQHVDALKIFGLTKIHRVNYKPIKHLAQYGQL